MITDLINNIAIVIDGSDSINYRGLKNEIIKVVDNQIAHLAKRSNETVAVLVPNQQGKFEAKKFGFPTDNIAIWDATSTTGMAEAGDTVRAAVESFMQARTTGVHSTRSLFNMDAQNLNKDTVKRSNLIPKLVPGTLVILT